ncbi:MAG: DNA-binding GntR family transcriptional regulator [Parasphingorhabdus sp.]|jgi:DNA-binding GntR family transcriptional regulator
MSLLKFQPIETAPGLKARVYAELREAISNMDIYSTPEPPKLDERRLAEELGVSRTPVREALSRLEQEGLVRNIPRRGAFVARKTRKEILEVICVWAALESMAARLATQNATDAEIGELRALFATFDDQDEARAHIDEYSDTNIDFHQSIMRLSKCELLQTMASGLFLHMRSIRVQAVKEHNRSDQSVIDHMRIIEAIEARDADAAEHLVREHAESLSKHIEMYSTYLD